jgi:hypothetical protein
LENAVRNVALAAVDARSDYEFAKVSRGAARPIRNAAFIDATRYHSKEGLTLSRRELDGIKSRLGEVSDSAVDRLVRLLDTQRGLLHW